MMGAIVIIIIGLFVWMVLPKLIFQKKTKKKAPYKQFTFVVCAIIGVLIMVFGAIELIKSIFNSLIH